MATEYAASSGAVTSTPLSVINNSTTVATDTADGWFALDLDLNDMTHGDELRVALYEKCRSGDTQRLVDYWVHTGPQEPKRWVSPAFMLMHGHDWTLTAVAGTSITVPRSLRRVGTSLTEAYSGTEAVGATEWSLTSDSSTVGSITTAGTYSVFLDLNDMAAGDKVRIRLYEKTTSSSTVRYREWFRTGAQTKPLFVIPAHMLINGWEVTATAISGTVTIPWSIRKV